MQQVSNTLLAALRANSKSLSVVCEIYDYNKTPPFAPNASDCLLRLAFTNGVSFLGQSYQRLIAKGGVGRITRVIKKQLSGCSLTLSNSDRSIWDFEQNIGFEGLTFVCRVIDRATSVNLADSMVLFTGTMNESDEFDKSSESCKIQIRQIINQTEVIVPRRTLTSEDPEGRAESDPEFEGFKNTARGGNINFQEKVAKGGLLGSLFGLKKTVTRTQAYSSHSDLRETTRLPLIFGRQPAKMILLASIDKGTWIDFVGLWCDGHEYGIEAINRVRSVTEGLTIGDQATKLGKKGGYVDDANTQAADDPSWFINEEFSRTAYTRGVVKGTTLQQDDSAPETVADVFGQKVPTPNGANFNQIVFSDSAVCLSRWLLSSQYYFKLDPAWHHDETNIETFNYLNHVLYDNQNTDTVLLPAAQNAFAGQQYKIFKSTGALSAKYWNYTIGIEQATIAFGAEVDYQYYDGNPYNSDDWAGTGVPQLPPTTFRRRATCNLTLLEEMSGIDFLYDIVYPSSNLYLTQKADGRIAHQVKKPAPFTFVKQSHAENTGLLEVADVEKFEINDLICVNSYLETAEVRTITGKSVNANYGQFIGVSASGGLSASASNLQNPVTLNVTSVSGTKSYTVDALTFGFTPAAGDNEATIALAIAGQINGNEILNKYIKAQRSGNSIVVHHKIGFLNVDPLAHLAQNEINAPAAAALYEEGGAFLQGGKYQYTRTYVTAEGETTPSPITEITVSAGAKIRVPASVLPARVLTIRHYFSTEVNGVRRRKIAETTGGEFYIFGCPRTTEKLEPIFNSTASEITKIAYAFTDKARAETGLTRSNMLKGSYSVKLESGVTKGGINQVKTTFRDSAADYKLTTLIVNDSEKQKKAKKPKTLEINGAGIDNEHQARRIANIALNEYGDGNRFAALSSDNEALLLEEGDVIAVTDESTRYVNKLHRIEGIEFDPADGYPQVGFMARSYKRYFYDDQTQERIVPLPIIQNYAINTEQVASVIYQSGAATNTSVPLTATNYSTQPYYRKIEISPLADFSNLALIRTVIVDAQNQVGFILGSDFNATRDTNLSVAESAFVRISQSSNGQTWSNVSNVEPITFTAADGSGGSAPQPTPEPGTSTGSGDNPPSPPDPQYPCFLAGTPIALMGGSTKPIEEVKVDDFVTAWHEKTGLLTRRRVREVFPKQHHEYLEVTFSDGSKVEVTKYHRYWTAKGFKAIGSLRKGSTVFNIDSEPVKVTGKKLVKKLVTVYNFSVEIDKTYIANGMRVSNAKPAPETL